jgi:hypothetical protein
MGALMDGNAPDCCCSMFMAPALIAVCCWRWACELGD